MKKRRPKPPRWRYPAAIESQQKVLILKLLKSLEGEIERVLFPQIDRLLLEAASVRPDGVYADAWLDSLSALIVALKSFQPSADGVLLSNALFITMATRVSDFNQRQLNAVLSPFLKSNIFIPQRWLPELLNNYGKENVQLIKSLQENLLNSVQSIVTRGVQQGLNYRAVEKQIKAQFNVPRKKAALLARDQVGKLNSQLTQNRQVESGIEKYTWSTSQDSRVRSSHRERNGKTFKWNAAPDDGHPGMSINCRCIAMPVLDDLLGDLS